MSSRVTDELSRRVAVSDLPYVVSCVGLVGGLWVVVGGRTVGDLEPGPASPQGPPALTHEQARGPTNKTRLELKSCDVEEAPRGEASAVHAATRSHPGEGCG